MTEKKAVIDPTIELIEALGEYTHDPLSFVYFAFPWGEPGLLEKMKGPEEWQREVLKDIGSGLKCPNEVIREAVASGHGIGKSAMVSWLILWAMSTHEDTRGVVTANTDTQLRTKTWPELIKWYNLFIGRTLFTVTATAIFSNEKGKEKNWRIDAIPWSENNTEAFAGLHNQGKRILMLFDEASAIANPIWEVAEGAMTDRDTEIIWCAFGNPTRNTGRFYDCFHKFRHLWKQRQVDSRTVSFSNKERIKEWIDTWGEDSDMCVSVCVDSSLMLRLFSLFLRSWRRRQGAGILSQSSLGLRRWLSEWIRHGWVMMLRLFGFVRDLWLKGLRRYRRMIMIWWWLI